jgi:uncharacterized repeat protein (TIGR02543 family)
MKIMRKLGLVLLMISTIFTVLACGDGVLVHFDSNGGEDVASVTLTGNTFDGTLPEPTRAGFAFEGWFYEEAFATPFSSTDIVISSITLFAKWSPMSYVVTIDINGTLTTQSVGHGGNAVLPVSPTKIGYTFTGWNSSVGGTTNGTNITAAQTITAVFQINTYTITFIADGQTITSRTVNHGGTVTNIPAVPDITGMNGIWDVTDFTNVTANFTVTAVYTNKVYVITYANTANATTTTINVEHGDVLTAPTPAVISGYDFVSWTGYDFSTPITGPMTITAVYQIKTFTVVFYGVSGAQIGEIQTVVLGQAATAPSYSGEVGYLFTGWDTVFSNVTANLNVHATFTMVQYTISFVENGGSTVTDIVADYLSVIVAPNLPVRSGYVFDGWYSDALMTEEYVFTAQSTMPLEGATLYAGWKADSFEVSFVPNNEMTFDPIEVLFGETFGLLPSPTKTGYVFNGWYENANFTGNPVVSNTVYTASTDSVLYASWNLKQVSISFQTNGGSIIATITAPYLSGVTAPNAPNKIGYAFAGWYQDVDLLVPYVFSTLPAENKILYAKWTINQYTITFDSNEGTAVAPITQNYASVVVAPAAPTRVGYIFVGWTSDELLTTDYLFTTMPAANLTLYAEWAADTDTPYTVDYYVQDLIGNTYSKFHTVTKYGNTDATGSADLTVFPGYTFADSHADNVLSGTIVGTGTLTLKVYYFRNVTTPFAIQYFHQNLTGSGFTLFETVALTGSTGATATALSKPYDGFTFDVNNPSNHLTGTISANGSLVLDVYYTRNEFTIVLDSQGGQSYDSLSVRYQGALTGLPTPTKEGYTFQGWIDETNVAYTPTSTVEGSLTLYASWRIKTFNVAITRTMLASDGVTVLSSEVINRTVSFGVNYSPITTIDGYAFIEVIHNSVSHTNFDYTLAITQNTAFEVVYKLKTVTVTFIQNPSGVDVTTRITVDYNTSIGSLPILTPKPGFTVVWARTAFNHLTEDQTVYAIYYADGVEAVTFVDGSAIRSIISATDNPGVDAILTAASNLWNPSKAGFKFLGWYYEADWQTMVDIDDMTWSTLNGSISIYAKWEQLQPFPTPTNIAVESQTVSWIQGNLLGTMPTAYLILINGTPYPILAADCIVNPSTGVVSYTFANNILTAAGTHQIAVKAVGDDINQLSSAFSQALAKVVETSSEDPGEVIETKYYDYFIVEKTLNSATYIFYTDMLYNFSSSYTLTILDGHEYASAVNNKLTTNNLPGTFRFSVTTSTGTKIFDGKVVSFINQFALGSNLATYNATTFLNYQNSEVITPYLIGSGNPFRFDLQILDNTGSRLSATDCSLVYLFSLWNGTSYVELTGSALTDMVVALPNYEFDFTTAAVGHKFKVTIAPRYQAIQVTVQSIDFEFEVNSGVNVFTNEEMKLYYNDLNYEIINLHANFKAELDASQLNPDGSPLNGWAFAVSETELVRKGNVYERLGYGTNDDNLVVHGNYFTIDGSSLPYMNANSGYGTTGFSEAFDIISVQIGIFAYNVYNYADSVDNDNSLTINNLTIIGNTVTPEVNYSLSSEEIASAEALMARNSGGFNGINIRSGEANINNVNIGFTGVAFFSTSYGVKSDLITPLYFNTNHIHVYSSWANSYYGWGVTGFNITNSLIDKSGGAAIHIEDIRPATGFINDPVIAIDESTEINNWVSGQEAWFKAYGMTGLVLDFKAQVNAGIDALGKTVLVTMVNPVTGLESEMVNLILLKKAMDNAETQDSGVTVSGSQVLLQLPTANGNITSFSTPFNYVSTDPRVVGGSFAYPVSDYSSLMNFGMAIEGLVPTIMGAMSVDEGTASAIAGQVVTLASWYNLPMMIALQVAGAIQANPTVPYINLVQAVLSGNGMSMPPQPRYLQVGATLPLDGATTSSTIILEMRDK